MAGFVSGDVVVLPFPFSDLTRAKRRPALIVATLPGDDLILCPITSQPARDPHAIRLEPDDFRLGSLKRVSHVRPGHLFTADSHLILYQIGALTDEKR